MLNRVEAIRVASLTSASPSLAGRPLRRISLRALHLVVISSLVAVFAASCEDEAGPDTAGGETSDATGIGDDDTDGGFGDDDDVVGPIPCTTDLECQFGESCIGGFCIDPDATTGDTDTGGTGGTCAGGGNPIIKVTPDDSVDFGFAAIGEISQKTVTITNVGQCPLVVSKVEFLNLATDEISCDVCTGTGTVYPITLAPFVDTLRVNLTYSPSDFKEDVAELQIVSSDVTNPAIRIGLISGVKGEAKKCYGLTEEEQAQFSALDFGYVEAGKTKTLATRVCNCLQLSAGNQPLEIKAIKMRDEENAFNFEIEKFETLPILNPQECVDIDITYKPLEEKKHNNFLVVQTNDVPSDGNNVVLNARANKDPVCVINPGTPIDFGQVLVGDVGRSPIVLQNQSDQQCEFSLAFAPLSSSDFSLDPTGTTIQLPPGGNSTVSVVYLSQAAGTDEGILLIGTNDPERLQNEIPIAGEAVERPATDILRVDAQYEHGSTDSFFVDFRVVDIQYEEAKSGALISVNQGNPAANWTNLGGKNYGNPRVAATGQPDPFRVTHLDPIIDDGCFNVVGAYLQDCERVVGGLLASILGIATGAIGGAIGIPGLGGLDLSGACLGTSSTNVTATAFVNGNAVMTHTITLGRKSDRKEILSIKREGGFFSAKPWSPTACN